MIGRHIERRKNTRTASVFRPAAAGKRACITHARHTAECRARSGKNKPHLLFKWALRCERTNEGGSVVKTGTFPDFADLRGVQQRIWAKSCNDAKYLSNLRFDRLRSVFRRGNSISSIDVGRLSSLTQLKHLDLSRNRLSSWPLGVALPNLKRL